MSELPLAPLHRIMKRQGAKRVGHRALEEFADVLEELAADLASESSKLAEHAGRRTVKGEDVRLARRRGF